MFFKPHSTMTRRTRTLSESEEGGAAAATGRKSSKLSQGDDATSARELELIYVIIFQL